jgi:hypothetical protein
MSRRYRRGNDVAFAAAVCCFAALVPASSAASQPRVYSLKIGDRFDISGTHIKCKIVRAAGGAPAVTCAPVTAGSNGLLPKSYGFSFGDRGVAVLGPPTANGPRPAVFRARTDPGLPLGDPAPADRSPTPKNVHLRPVAQGLEGVNVGRSSVVCVVVAYPRPHGPVLNCTLSSRAIAAALRRPRLAFRPLTVTLSPQLLRVWRMSKAKTQREIFSRSEPAS